MLYLNNATRYHFYLPPIDMRKGCFKLCALVTMELGMDVLQGDVFVFLAKHKRKIKLLQWEGDGFAVYEKQLSKGCFEQPLLDVFDGTNKSIPLPMRTLQNILQGIIQQTVRYKKRYVHKPLGSALSHA